MPTPTITKERLAELLAKARANNPKLERRKDEVTAAGYGNRATDQMKEDSDVANFKTTTISNAINTLTNNTDLIGLDRSTGKAIQYNEKQLAFVELASSGNSAVLIGAAGSGKTTCQRGVISSLITSGFAGLMDADGHKYLRDKSPGIIIVSFTRRAVSNIRKAVAEDMKHNCLTIHAALEYEPVYHEVWDEAVGEYKKTMSFEPTRTADRPLPSSIKTCVIEESSMVSVELFTELKDALPSNCQFIFLGDIQQLPPVFGAAILGYKMLELPVIELTEIYRQALESPIIRLAHRILSGQPIPASEYAEWKFNNQLTLHPWKKKLDADLALRTIAKFLTTAIDNNLYNPDEDMVLIPFNKACGTIELNKYIAQHMARKNNRVVWEVIGGFEKSYFSVGDKILYDKEDAVITKIFPNPAYDGASAQPESVHLDYWGYNSSTGGDSQHHIDNASDDDIDFMLAQSVKGGNGEDRVRQSSHEITIKLLETDREITLNTAGQLNALILSFALTVHKSQGSEFRKVFLMLHQSHATMLSRELLYTAVTRAKEELYVICEPESFTKGINSQRIKGNTLAEKAEYFKGKISANGNGDM
jgi:exodeoxyribonuclease V alpha subunit